MFVVQAQNSLHHLRLHWIILFNFISTQKWNVFLCCIWWALKSLKAEDDRSTYTCCWSPLVLLPVVIASDFQCNCISGVAASLCVDETSNHGRKSLWWNRQSAIVCIWISICSKCLHFAPLIVGTFSNQTGTTFRSIWACSSRVLFL